MLLVSEFEMGEVLRNSDGEIIEEFNSKTYVAVYDDKEYNEVNLEKDINKYFYDGIENENLVIMEANRYKKLTKMMSDNYNITPKED